MSQDHALGSDQHIIDEKLNGDYRPLSDGEERNVFILDPRNKSNALRGEVTFIDQLLIQNLNSFTT